MSSIVSLKGVLVNLLCVFDLFMRMLGQLRFGVFFFFFFHPDITYSVDWVLNK